METEQLGLRLAAAADHTSTLARQPIVDYELVLRGNHYVFRDLSSGKHK